MNLTSKMSSAWLGLATLLISTCMASADEMSNILGGADPSPVQFGGTSIPKLPAGPGNYSGVSQIGAGNSATVEQQAILGSYANVATLNQNGNNNSAGLTQSNSSGSYLGLNQNGNGNSATLGQTGSNLGLQVNQSGGASIGVTQFGTGTVGAPPITITQSR